MISVFVFRYYTAPPKKDWTSSNSFKFKGLTPATTLYSKLIENPKRQVESLRKTIYNEPSSSLSPVTNQGFNLILSVFPEVQYVLTFSFVLQIPLFLMENNELLFDVLIEWEVSEPVVGKFVDLCYM